MVWQGLPGSGDLLMSSGDTLATGTVSAQVGHFGSLNLTQVTAQNIAISGVQSFGQTNVASALRLPAGGNILLGPTVAQVSSARTVIGMFDVAQTGGRAPASGDLNIGGWLYVQSGGLHFMGALGTVTIVGSP